MAQRAAVPKFGNWGGGENTAYTMYFENARKGRKPHNPNDPQENPNLAGFEGNDNKPSPPPPKTAPNPRPTSGSRANRTGTQPPEPRDQVIERKPRADQGDVRRAQNGSGRNDGNINGRANNANPSHQGVGDYGELRKRAGYNGGFGPEGNKASGRGSGPSGGPVFASEEKGIYGTSHGTPGRPRARPLSQGDGNFNRGAAIPKFGDWNAKNPAMSDGYTQVFNKVREEKHQRGPGMSPAVVPESPFNNRPAKRVERDEPTGGCCFPWGRK